MDRLAGALVLPAPGVGRIPWARDTPEPGEDRATPLLGARGAAAAPPPLFVGLTEGGAPEFRAALPAWGTFLGEDAPVLPPDMARSEGLAGAPAAGLPWALWAEGLPPPARTWGRLAAAAPLEEVLEVGVLAAGVPALPPPWLTRSEGLALDSTWATPPRGLPGRALPWPEAPEGRTAPSEGVPGRAVRAPGAATPGRPAAVRSAPGWATPTLPVLEAEAGEAVPLDRGLAVRASATTEFGLSLKLVETYPPLGEATRTTRCAGTT